MFGWISDYRSGMLAYDRNNPPSLRSSFFAFADEFTEMIEAFWGLCVVLFCCKSGFYHALDEAHSEIWDAVHSFLRLVQNIIVQVPVVGPIVQPVVVLLPVLGWKTAKKHAIRFRTYGCIRSARHCAAKDHVCGRSECM